MQQNLQKVRKQLSKETEFQTFSRTVINEIKNSLELFIGKNIKSSIIWEKLYKQTVIILVSIPLPKRIRAAEKYFHTRPAANSFPLSTVMLFFSFSEIFTNAAIVVNCKGFILPVVNFIGNKITAFTLNVGSNSACPHFSEDGFAFSMSEAGAIFAPAVLSLLLTLLVFLC